MVELLSRFSGGELIAVIAIVGGLTCGTIVLIGDYWRKIRKAEIDARLKADMLDRGMSADEIKTVLEAGAEKAEE